MVELHAKVKVRITEVVTDEDGNKQNKTSIVDTTIGRALAEILPEGLPFALANTELTKKNISRLINLQLPPAGPEGHGRVRRQADVHRLRLRDPRRRLDRHRRHADPGREKGILTEAEAEVLEIQEQYQSGLVTAGERYNKVVDISRTNERIAKAMMDTIGTEKVVNARARPSTRSR